MRYCNALSSARARLSRIVKLFPGYKSANVFKDKKIKGRNTYLSHIKRKTIVRHSAERAQHYLVCLTFELSLDVQDFAPSRLALTKAPNESARMLNCFGKTAATDACFFVRFFASIRKSPSGRERRAAMQCAPDIVGLFAIKQLFYPTFVLRRALSLREERVGSEEKRLGNNCALQCIRIFDL